VDGRLGLTVEIKLRFKIYPRCLKVKEIWKLNGLLLPTRTPSIYTLLHAGC